MRWGVLVWMRVRACARARACECYTSFLSLPSPPHTHASEPKSVGARACACACACVRACLRARMCVRACLSRLHGRRSILGPESRTSWRKAGASGLSGLLVAGPSRLHGTSAAGRRPRSGRAIPLLAPSTTATPVRVRGRLPGQRPRRRPRHVSAPPARAPSRRTNSSPAGFSCARDTELLAGRIPVSCSPSAEQADRKHGTPRFRHSFFSPLPAPLFFRFRHSFLSPLPATPPLLLIPYHST